MKWNADMQFPTDNDYTNRIIEITFKPSSSGNCMVIIECELVSPSTKLITIGSESVEVDVTGIKTKNYYPTTMFEEDGKTVDTKRTSEARDRFENLLVDLELITKEQTRSIAKEPNPIDWDNVNVTQLKGKHISTMMESDVRTKRKTPTAAQIAEAKKKGTYPEGDVMKNPRTGKDEIQYWPKITKIYGLATSGNVSGRF